jgi:superfamily II DNA or RNA helicase/predicted house-cleaning noncanonical NTP pyrophosphatase (MazG superfamily)/HKD family nuclease
MKKPAPIIYNKLVRDRIPEIIGVAGKEYFIHTADPDELRQAIGKKLLEEAGEFHEAWQDGEPKEILKEAADVLEVLLTGLEHHEMGLEELIAEKNARAEKRGGFGQGIMLESVHLPVPDNVDDSGPRFISTRLSSSAMTDTIVSELEQSDATAIASAFYAPGQTNILVSALDRFVAQGGEARVLLSTMNNLNKPEHLNHLQQAVPEVRVKVFHPPHLPFSKNPPPFHAKLYLFSRRDKTGAMLIGSSNLTPSGMSGNIEWNYHSCGEINLKREGSSPFRDALAEFTDCWENQAVPVSDEFIEGYKLRWAESRDSASSGFEETPSSGYGPTQKDTVTPNSSQAEALIALDKIRNQGITRAAVIAATGLGKTFLAAFDFLQTGKGRVLFIAHRWSILTKAMETFARVFGPSKRFCLLGNGMSCDPRADGCFAMIQTLSREEHLSTISPLHFDYVVMDEFHHSEADSYKRVLDHFDPGFFLGLTATPERMDGRDVLKHCDYNVAYEIRVLDAIDRGWLVPFQYFAIHDETDYSHITWKRTDYDEEELTNALSRDTRTAIVAANLKRYLPSTGKIKALAFCSSVNHARYTAERLSRNHGIVSTSLTGESSQEQREIVITRLRDENDSLQVICTVDLFNEGVDIPELTHLLFLRPTLSFTVFLQQLGRGLRIADGKEFVVVLDFVGNFRKAHVAPLALQGFTSLHEYLKNRLNRKKSKQVRQPPAGCYIAPDIQVERIWNSQITGLVERLPLRDRLKSLYLDIRADLGTSPLLMDFVNNSYRADPYEFIQEFKSWIKAKHYCDDDLSHSEKRVLKTPGETFLAHLEKDLRPNKSYKMVVLKVLLELDGPEGWKITDIARKFLDFYLGHREYLGDYDNLARHEPPEKFPLNRVVTHLKAMPLNYLSNTPKDWFVLDSRKGEFRLKEEIVPFWKDEAFRALVRDRVEFGLNRYFARKREK